VSERPIRLFGDPVLRTPCDAVFVDRLSGSVRKQAMRDLRERYIS